MDPKTKQRVCKNQYCAAVECLYYVTHHQFKVDAQAFDVVMELPRYIHIAKANPEWLISKHPREEKPQEGINTGNLVKPLLRAASGLSPQQPTHQSCGAVYSQLEGKLTCKQSCTLG